MRCIKPFKRHIIPSVLAILLDIFVCEGSNWDFSSIVNPKKLNSLTFSFFSVLIFMSGTIGSMFLLMMMKDHELSFTYIQW